GLASQEDLAFCQQRHQWPPDRLNPLPLITGDDLKLHGVAPGKVYRELLTAVRDAQLNGEISTKQQALARVDQIGLQ
ncbi:MAG: hypothetical protein N2C12_00225, partial [Planctomycetales bacterium]